MTTTTTTEGSFERLRASVQAGLLERADEHVGRLGWTVDRIAAHQRDALRALLAHAVTHSPFHRRRLAGIDAARFEVADLAQLPVMTKTEMMDELDEVFTDRRLTTAIVERALAATVTEPVPIHDEYFALSSGGSSGRRGVFVFDRPAAVAFFSALSRGLIAKMQGLGGPPPGGLPIAQVSAASAVHATGSSPAWTAGGDAPFRFSAVPVTLPLAEIVERLNAMQPPILFGYPSMLARLAAEQQAGRLRITPLSITSTSEMLLPELRDAIREGFGAPIVDTFGSTEGLVGVSAPDDDVLVFASDVCIVELVDDADQPVPLGEASSKVLITNLSNRTQPLIRYELNDSFVRRPDVPEHGHLRATVRGRADDVLRYDDVDIHPLVIRAVMLKAPEVSEYQVRQTARGVAIAAVASAACDTERLCRRVHAALAEAGLANADVEVERVATLDRHPETGKFRRFVPLA
jgi:phenylacetate-coenzyme A ligase PaaK-like adenylate-forming protein